MLLKFQYCAPQKVIEPSLPSAKHRPLEPPHQIPQVGNHSPRPAVTETYVSPAGKLGTLHSPLVLLPQATIEPSLRSAAQLRYPAATCVYFSGGGSAGGGSESTPQCEISPSLR